MSNRFSTGKYALAECDVCGFQYKLTQLKSMTTDHQPNNIFACPDCWNAEHPQNDLGKYPVHDPQAIRNARPDKALAESRKLSWGWNPVAPSNPLTPSSNQLEASLGTVTVVIS